MVGWEADEDVAKEGEMGDGRHWRGRGKKKKWMSLKEDDEEGCW